MFLWKWKLLKNDSNLYVFWCSGGVKMMFFFICFLCILETVFFEHVKKQLVFIANSPRSFLKSWSKNMIFLIFEGFLPRDPPSRNSWYFIIPMKNSPPKKVFLVIFGGGLGGPQSGFGRTFFSKTPFGWLLFFFDENLNISVDHWKMMIFWRYKYSENVMF